MLTFPASNEYEGLVYTNTKIPRIDKQLTSRMFLHDITTGASINWRNVAWVATHVKTKKTPSTQFTRSRKNSKAINGSWPFLKRERFDGIARNSRANFVPASYKKDLSMWKCEDLQWNQLCLALSTAFAFEFLCKTANFYFVQVIILFRVQFATGLQEAAIARAASASATSGFWKTHSVNYSKLNEKILMII